MVPEYLVEIKRGEVYLVDFGQKFQSELGKVRPAVIMQSNYINDNLDIAPYKSILVIPFTTDLRGGRFRLEVKPRDRLEKKSELIINWMCTVDSVRVKEEKFLTILNKEELKELRRKLDFFMGYFD